MNENEIVGIGNVYGDPSGLYSGISRSELDIPWNTTDTAEALDNFRARMRDLPAAIAQLEATKPYVRGYVLEEYAAWKMENDCHQLPEELAVFIRVCIAKNEFFYTLERAIIGAM